MKNPNYEKLPRSESAEIGGGNANCEKIPTVRVLHQSESAEISGGSPNHEKFKLCRPGWQPGTAAAGVFFSLEALAGMVELMFFIMVWAQKGVVRAVGACP